MPRSKDETAVTRRRFLGGLAAAAAAQPLIALGNAEAATAKKKKAAAPAAKPEPALAKGPNYSVAKTPEERTALEKQWKQAVDTVEGLRKVAVPVGAEFATGAMAPKKLRRGEA